MNTGQAECAAQTGWHRCPGVRQPHDTAPRGWRAIRNLGMDLPGSTGAWHGGGLAGRDGEGLRHRPYNAMMYSQKDFKVNHHSKSGEL